MVRSNIRSTTICKLRGRWAASPSLRPCECFCPGRSRMARPRRSAFVPAPNMGRPSDGFRNASPRWPRRFQRSSRSNGFCSAPPATRRSARSSNASVGANCINRIGKTTLHELIAELSECALLLTNDTGTMHLATILGVPVVAVFGSTEPRLTGPLGSGHHVFAIKSNAAPAFCGNARLISAA